MMFVLIFHQGFPSILLEGLVNNKVNETFAQGLKTFSRGERIFIILELVFANTGTFPHVIKLGIWEFCQNIHDMVKFHITSCLRVVAKKVFYNIPYISSLSDITFAKIQCFYENAKSRYP